jgi:hypothetical protein
MATKVRKVLCVLLLCLTAVSCLPRPALADDVPTAFAGSPVIWLAAGALAVNVGATIANGAALAAGRPNRGNGMFGVVLGSATVAAGAVSFAFSDGDTDSERFSIVLASCGLASLLTGYLNVRGAGADASGVGRVGGPAARLVVGPRGGAGGRGWVAAVQVGF